MTENQRESYSFTLRAYQGDTNAIELIRYLRSLGRSVAKQKIEDALMKTLLSLAKQHSGNYTQEQLRLSCLSSIDALVSHSNYLRQAFNISEPQHLYSYPVSLPVQSQPYIKEYKSSVEVANGSTVTDRTESIEPSLEKNKPINDRAGSSVEEKQDDFLDKSVPDEDMNLLNSQFNF